jgi:pyruvate kinase
LAVLLGMTRRTKIVATIGPSSREPADLKAILEAGVDVCRINCSHATHDAIERDIARIRRIAVELGRHIGILLDLQGPKIRTGEIDPPLTLVRGDLLEVVMDADFRASGKRVGTTWPTLSSDVKVGEPVLFADGALSGEVVTVTPTVVTIRMIDGGVLGSHKGINLPASKISAPALTDKDIGDLAVGVRAGADYVALSFVRSAADVRLLKDHLARLDAAEVPILAKIEKPQGVDAIDEILAVVDGIMVARGDLGVEMPLELVPVIQKRLIHAANDKGVLVITATQMLDSMERNPRPTRAESTDVANAIVDGTDAVMLSGETANGKYPVRAVEVMDRIARAVEESPYNVPPPIDSLSTLRGSDHTVVRAACYAVRESRRALVVFTGSGHTAILASKSRPPGPIFALSPSDTVLDRLALAWGVVGVHVPVIRNTDELIAVGEAALLDRGLVEPDQEVVVLAGKGLTRGSTNMMKVERVNRERD